MTKRIRREMAMRECDLVGIAPAERVDSMIPQLKDIFEGEVELVAVNKADTIYKPYKPEITYRFLYPSKISILQKNAFCQGLKPNFFCIKFVVETLKKSMRVYNILRFC